MENIDIIIENYKRLSDDELVYKAQHPESLRSEIIPHLQAELIKRNKGDNSLLLTQFLIDKPKTYKDYSNAEMLEMIHERISNGESIENIKIDLKESGINILDHFGEVKSYEHKTMEYIASLKEEGYDDDAIDERMKNVFELSAEETDVLKHQVKSKGKHNVIIGVLVVVLFGVLSLALLADQGSVSIVFLLLIIAGIGLILKGEKWAK